jgi:peptidoglycan/xylan/chitin deacetylase (PgdA/CDA1 family)
MLKNRILHIFSIMVFKLRVLPALLAIVNRWGAKRDIDDRVVFPFVRKQTHHSFQILLYHRVNDDQDPFFSGVPVKVFAEQMELLHRFFKVMVLEELIERATKNDIPPNAVALTFDDGYRDNYEHAFPILKHYGLPATIFLATGGVESPTLLWHDRVFDALRRTRSGSVVIKTQVYPLTTLAEKRLALGVALRELRMCTPLARETLIQRLATQLQVLEPCHRQAQKLCWGEIEEMAQGNIAFGAHTVTHPVLTRMPLEEAVEEIMASKATIERHLHAPVRLFAYPNGGREDINAAIKQALKTAGFLGAVSTLWGSNNASTDAYELRRVRAWGGHPPLSILRLGWYRFALSPPDEDARQDVPHGSC